MVLVKSWILCKPFEGDAKKENFELVKEEIEPILEDGVKYICFSTFHTLSLSRILIESGSQSPSAVSSRLALITN